MSISGPLHGSPIARYHRRAEESPALRSRLSSAGVPAALRRPQEDYGTLCVYYSTAEGNADTYTGTRSRKDFCSGAFLCAYHHDEIRGKDKGVDDDDCGQHELACCLCPGAGVITAGDCEMKALAEFRSNIQCG
jgi:hypothetical protein